MRKLGHSRQTPLTGSFGASCRVKAALAGSFHAFCRVKAALIGSFHAFCRVKAALIGSFHAFCLVKAALAGSVCALFALLVFAYPAQAQTTHSVTLTWADTLNPAGTTYSVYRATGLCSGTPTFNKLATAVAAKNYQDSTVTPGNYCYTVTATFSGMESAQTTPVNPPVPAFTVTALSFTVQ